MQIVRQNIVNRPKSAYISTHRQLLGRNTSWSHHLQDEHGPFAWYPNRRTGLISYIGGPGRGKTVLLKRDIDYELAIDPKRPMVIFDMQGADHRLMRDPSDTGVIFKSQGEYRHGHKQAISLTPAYLHDDNTYGDREFTIPWTDLTLAEWEYLLVVGSDAKSWINQFKSMLRRNKSKIKSLAHLMWEIDAKAANNAYSSEIIPKLPDLIINAMQNSLRVIIDGGYLSEKDDPRNLRITELMEKGCVPVLNFHLDEETPTRLYTGVLARQIYNYYNRKMAFYAKKYPGALIKAPNIIFEEFNQLVPVRANKNDEAPGEKWVKLIITKGMKIGFKLRLVMQDTMDITGKIRRNIYNNTIFVSNATNDDMALIEKRFGETTKNGEPWVGEVLRDLDPQPDESGAFEWLCIDRGEPFTFRPGVSMSQYHKR